ncbi:carbon-nitrogen hydrolase family protein [Candidatus Njordibacter sp. Uisw_039]|jgi:predicted amidohydrolase|uniref:carbon-nitrogen hydrolase family protein n=1 Tax=Candidatus Njordibacter sp. Uisw_039 TaxID=3230972 RepID=UPI003A4656C4
MADTNLIVAVAQVDASREAGDARIQWLDEQLQLAKAQAVELLVLPELFVSGYNAGSLIEKLAETTDGVTAKAITMLAKKYHIAIHYGFAERDGVKLYNAAQCIGPKGNVLGQYRKRLLPPGFEATYFTKGNGIGLFRWRGFNIGMLICYDAEFPELSRQLALAGADIILVPTALGSQWGWVAQQMMPTRGYENGVYFVYANYCGEENGMAFLGESFIGCPIGRQQQDEQDLARAGSDEALIVATIKLERVKLAQARLPYLTDCRHVIQARGLI